MKTINGRELKNCTDVAIRVDADSQIGIGHLKRCLTLFSQLTIDGFNVRLIGRAPFGKEIESLLRGIPISWLQFSGASPRDHEIRDAEATLSIIGRQSDRPSRVILDHYGLGESWESLIREAGHRVLVIDDFRNRRHCADVLVSDTNRPFNPALNQCPGTVRVLVGADYALVDPAFAYAEEHLSSLKAKKRILISYGGSDPTDETTKALEAVRLVRLNEVSRDLIGEVDVVVGHGNTRKGSVSRLAKQIQDVIVHLSPGSLAPLMRQADLLLIAGGNSMVEGLTLRKPCLVTRTSNNQSLMVDQLLEQQAIFLLGSHKDVRPGDVVNAVTKFLFEYEQHASVVKARPFFDNLGARRISAAIQQL